jgi:hypothetical protein
MMAARGGGRSREGQKQRGQSRRETQDDDEKGVYEKGRGWG